jgi:hypothetical protein
MGVGGVGGGDDVRGDERTNDVGALRWRPQLQLIYLMTIRICA